MATKKKSTKKTEETGAQEAQRLTREATKSRAGGPLGPAVTDEENNGGRQPGTEDVPV
jgi:hypothetical protein